MGNHSAGTDTYWDNMPVFDVNENDAFVESLGDHFFALLSAKTDHMATTDDSRQVSPLPSSRLVPSSPIKLLVIPRTTRSDWSVLQAVTTFSLGRGRGPSAL